MANKQIALEMSFRRETESIELVKGKCMFNKKNKEQSPFSRFPDMESLCHLILQALLVEGVFKIYLAI